MPLTPITDLLVRPSWVNASRAAWSAVKGAAALHSPLTLTLILTLTPPLEPLP